MPFGNEIRHFVLTGADKGFQDWRSVPLLRIRVYLTNSIKYESDPGEACVHQPVVPSFSNLTCIDYDDSNDSACNMFEV